ncbi:hypothetical protein IWX91DRAFT_334476 [Phyllosticta citricarpa]
MGQSDAVRVEQGTPTSTLEKTLEQPSPPYSAFPQSTRRLILFAVTCAGFFGPLAGAVYLPAIPLFSSIFHTEDDVISATVSVYMAIFAVSVRSSHSQIPKATGSRRIRSLWHGEHSPTTKVAVPSISSLSQYLF